MRTLAIDLGTRRIGLAISDEGGRYATPHEVLTVTDPLQAIDPIVQLIEREAIEQIVIGLPLNMHDGSLSAQARSIIVWAAALRKKSDVPLRKGTPLFFVDERLSSFAAEQQLIERKPQRREADAEAKKEQLDAIAAASFLQAFLDGQLSTIEVSKLS